jgi:hypothetical protein
MLNAVAASSPLLRLPLLAVVAIAALLALAAPAMAQTAVDPGTTAVQQDGIEPPDDGTVGPGIVITDPADETEPGEQDDPSDLADATSEVDDAADDADESDPAATPKRGELHVLGATASTRPAAVAAQPRAAASATPATLPFTGVNAGLIALAGAALLAAGMMVRRTTAAA